MVALAVKVYPDKVELFMSGKHEGNSHAQTTGIFTEKQRHTIKTVVRVSPMSVGSAVHAGLKNLSPGNHVKADRRSRRAVTAGAHRAR